MAEILETSCTNQSYRLELETMQAQSLKWDLAPGPLLYHQLGLRLQQNLVTSLHSDHSSCWCQLATNKEENDFKQLFQHIQPEDKKQEGSQAHTNNDDNIDDDDDDEGGAGGGSGGGGGGGGSGSGGGDDDDDEEDDDGGGSGVGGSGGGGGGDDVDEDDDGGGGGGDDGGGDDDDDNDGGGGGDGGGIDDAMMIRRLNTTKLIAKQFWVKTSFCSMLLCGKIIKNETPMS